MLGVLVCRNKTNFDRKNANDYLTRSLNDNYFAHCREWPYKNVPRKIIAEKYMGENLTDYKNYCFNGKLMYTLVWENKSNEEGMKPQAYFCGSYDRSWGKTSMELDYPSVNKIVNRPECYEEMIHVCETMSQGIPFVRVDCYIIDGNVYVGEMTFFPWGGFHKFKGDEWNEPLGNLINLPKNK